MARAVQTVVVLLIIVFYAETRFQAHRPGGIDLTGYLAAARALAHGDDPYHVANAAFSYIYPLTLAFLLIPITAVWYDVAIALWYVLAVGSLFFVMRAMGRWHGFERWRWTLSLLVLLGFLEPIQNDLMNGQVNAEIVLLMFLFFTGYASGRKAIAGVFLGLAISIKLLPAIFCMFLVWRREFRTLSIAVLASAMFVLLPYAAAGQSTIVFYQSYLNEFLRHQLVASPDSQRVFFTPYGFIGFLLPSLDLSNTVRYGVIVLTMGALAAFDRARTSDVDPIRFLAYLLAIPLVSPMSEIHHLILAVPAAVVVTEAAMADGAAVPRMIAAVFWVSLWTSHASPEGPFYFLSLFALAVGLVRIGTRDLRQPANAVRWGFAP